MFDKAKEYINTKTQERETMKKEIEADNAAFEAECKKNREIVETRQKEASENIRCPLCQGDKFFRNIRIAYANYNGSDCSTYIALNREEGLSAHNYNKFGTLPINTYVCKKCGNIIQKMDFSLLDDFCFRDTDRDYTWIPPVQWEE